MNHTLSGKRAPVDEKRTILQVVRANPDSQTPPPPLPSRLDSTPHVDPSAPVTDTWRFLRREAPLLAYGLTLTFLSSVGQTFLVSLFVPSFLAEFALTEAGFGALYSVATLTGAFLLPWIGSRMDRTVLHRFTIEVVALLAFSAFLVAASWHVAVLGVALVGIRLAGQGLSSHTALTAMARYFEAARGRALSISNLGFALGEGVLPLLLAASIPLVGWRLTWVELGVATLLFGPLLVRLLRRSGVELDPRKAAAAGHAVPAPARPPAGAPAAPGPRVWRRREVLRDPRFWFVLPAALLPPFWVTGLFLYQTTIAASRGWSVTLMASAFVAYASARVAFTLGAGGAIDRLSARIVLPFGLVPLAGGIALLWLVEEAWVAYAFMGLVGVTMGISSAVSGALWAELYGVRRLGAIQSMTGSMMVVSTAASPAITGFVLSRPGGLEALLVAAVVTVIAGALLALGTAWPREQ